MCCGVCVERNGAKHPSSSSDVLLPVVNTGGNSGLKITAGSEDGTRVVTVVQDTVTTKNMHRVRIVLVACRLLDVSKTHHD